MSKKTLLEIVQEILSDMVSDEVNSIDDTIESQGVASTVRSVYQAMVANRNWPHTKKMFQLESLGDVAKPIYMRMPERLKELVSISYDARKDGETSTQYKEIKYKDPEAFLRMCSRRKEELDNVVSYTDFSGVKLLAFNDRAPEYWTSFDDNYIVFDSYDVSVDDTLKSSKTACIAYFIPVWEHSNEAIPDLPSEAFPALIAEAKSTAFYDFKQMANEKEERRSVQQSRWLARKAWRAKGGVVYPNFGRKR
jgi:hypothetical protein